MKDWLDAALASLSLSEEAEGYLLGRGLQEERIRDLGIVVWDSDVVGRAPDPDFREAHGDKGHRWNNRVCIPIRSPRGALIGVEARVWAGEKKVSQFLLPEAHWNPVLIGLTPAVMQRIWDGGNVWVGEGLFDAAAMEHVIPKSDAAIATLRARVSEPHATFFKRFAQGWVNLVYDNDETGRKQTNGYVDEKTGKRRWGAIEVLTRVGVKARDIPYRGGKDPGEIWERSGVPGLRRAFAASL